MPKIINATRRIIANHQYETLCQTCGENEDLHTCKKFVAIQIDAVSANAYNVVYDAINPKNRKHLEARSIPRQFDAVWKCVRTTNERVKQ